MNKLKGKENIASLFESGKRLSEYPLRLYYKKADELAFGVSVGKQRFPLAVDRNKIKRLLRVGVKKHLIKPLENCDCNHFHIMVMFIGNTTPKMSELDVVFKTLAIELKKLLF